jgi:peptidoglycan/xylan/chitin deacetylase (PgdA/CDA1 family)
MNPNALHLLVLNYHEIIPDEVAATAGDPVYSVTLSAFRQQLDTIAAHGVPVISLDAFAAGTVNAPFAVALTFDDGYASDFTLVLPELEQRGLTAAFFPFTAAIGTPGRLTTQQLQQLVQRNQLAGSHGVSHTSFRMLSAEAQQQELEQSKQQLEQLTGKPVHYFSAPYGWYTTSMCRSAQQAGYKAVLTTRFLINRSGRTAGCIHRRNIERDTSAEAFSTLLKSGGRLPLLGQAKSLLHHGLRQLIPLGGGQSWTVEPVKKHPPA